MNKKLVGIIVLIGVIASSAYVWFFVYNKDHADMSQAEPDVIISAEDLYTAYSVDERGSSLAYNGKVLEVTGTISNVKENSGFTNIYLATSDMLAEISAELDSAFVFDSNAYEIGQEITVRGECAGYNVDVVLNRCYIVQ